MKQLQRISCLGVQRTFMVAGMLALTSFVIDMNAQASIASSLTPYDLRCEYLDNPMGIDSVEPRLSWRLSSEERGQKQVAYRILVASTAEKLAAEEADLWDSGKTESEKSLFIKYQGTALASRQECYWKVSVWGKNSNKPTDSQVAKWSVGLLNDNDWIAKYISYEDEAPVHTDINNLHLPAARQYRKQFSSNKQLKRATVYASALGIYELYLNGKQVSDSFFAPGWTDYHQRAYYNTYDVTDLVRNGENAIGAWVADGWYSGYVGFGLLTGLGTEKTGRSTYGKTPALLTQLELEFQDGSKKIVATDATWKVTGNGPIQEADLLMGEAYDARQEIQGWAEPQLDDSDWEDAILAKENKSTRATFYQFQNPSENEQDIRYGGKEIKLDFKRPKLEAFPGVPVRVVKKLPALSIKQHGHGKFIFDFGQNFAGTIRMKVKGQSGDQIRLRYAEMLHPDGSLMTENLRKARATDFYTCRGKSEGEVYTPRFTYHGFQYVELSNYPGTPTLEDVVGLVLQSDTPITSSFECSDPMVNQLFQNVVWTQRANFIDLPTDCPQRDERMGWTGDAQAYIATAAYNADIGAFYTKWLRELMESQRPSGAFPGYAPFPFQHGLDFGTAWADAGVICPWTIWQFYGDTDVIENCWDPMVKFMQWRQRTSVDNLGIAHGNPWGDWLAQGGTTPIEYIDTVYYAISSRMMSQMAEAIGKDDAAINYSDQFEKIKKAFQDKYLNENGTVKIKTQTAQALALYSGLIPEHQQEFVGEHLAKIISDNGNHMATGFLGTRLLLPVLSASNQNDLAVFLLQSHEFPSWGYEIANGATTIWERWDSYTKEDSFGRHNAAMNSFSHYAFGAVCEWMFTDLAGIRSGGPGFKNIIIRPQPPTPGSNAMHDPIHWVRATYNSIRGTIISDWRIVEDKFQLKVTIPANTTATVYVPTNDTSSLRESGNPLSENQNVQILSIDKTETALSINSGNYKFTSDYNSKNIVVGRRTFEPIDNSINPDEIDLRGAKKIVSWDFTNPEEASRWVSRKNIITESLSKGVLLKAAGEDPQMQTNLMLPGTGKIALELKAKPSANITTQFYWSTPGNSYSESQQTKRRLRKSNQVNSYLFKISSEESIDRLRFDPFQSYSEHSKNPGLKVESITIFELP